MGKKVLVVDNHPMILKMVGSVLEKEGHEVMTANDGLAALGVLEVYEPDVIFLDLVMPNISGEKLCRIIRSMPNFQETYIVVLSAIAAETNINYREFGADACVAKGSLKSIQKHILDSVDKAGSAPEDSTRQILGLEGTKLQAITKELLSSQKHFEAIVNNMSEGVFELTLEGKIIFANPAAVELCSTEEEKLLATHFADLFEDAHDAVSSAISTPDSFPAFNEHKIPLTLKERYVSLSFLQVKHDGTHTIIAIVTDISGQHESEVEIQASETRFRELFDNMSSGVAVMKPVDKGCNDFVFIDFNQAAEQIEKIKKEKVIGRKLLDIFPGVKKLGLIEILQRVWNSGLPEKLPATRYKGKRVSGWRENYVYKLPSGEVVAIFEDVSEQKNAETKLSFQLTLNETMAKVSQMIISADTLGDISKVLLQEAQQLIPCDYGLVAYVDRQSGKLHAPIISADVSDQCTAAESPVVLHNPEGLLGWVVNNKATLLSNDVENDPRGGGHPPGHVTMKNALAVPAMLDGKFIGMITLANAPNDFSLKDQATLEHMASLYALAVQRHWAEMRIAFLAHHDPLTGLINRHLLPDRLAQAMVLANRHRKKIAIFYMDLDKFKQINDTLGHHAGDTVLEEVARRLQASVRESDTVARMGGDEFVVVIHDVAKKKDAITVAKKLLKTFRAPVKTQDKELDIAVSIGISMYPDDDNDIEALLQKADEAMYLTKEKNGNDFSFFSAN